MPSSSVNEIHRFKSPFTPFGKGGWGDLGGDVVAASLEGRQADALPTIKAGTAFQHWSKSLSMNIRVVAARLW